MDSYTANWINQPWNVRSSAETDLAQGDILLFTGGMTIEHWQGTTQLAPWATGCAWDTNSSSLRGITPDGSWSFVIVRDPGTGWLRCTVTDLAAQRRRRLGILLGTVAGGLAGLLTGFAVGVPPVEAIAVGLSASILSALVTVGTTSYNLRTGDTWVANEGGSGLPGEPGTPPEETGRRIQTPSLRPTEA